MNFAYLLLTSALPVVKVCLLALVGAALAHIGVLDARGRQSLSRLIFYVFIPSLTFTKLGASVDLHNMSRWWILPVNVLISITIGMGIGWVCSRLLKAPKKLRPHIICCIATGNVGNLPMVLVAALCDDQSSAVAHAVAPQRCYELGIAYVVFAMWVAGLFQFSVAYALLRPSPETLEEKERGLPVVLHERPGHLMLTSAFHDLTDIGRLELQPLRSMLSSSASNQPEHAQDSSGGLGGTERLLTHEDPGLHANPYQQGRAQNGDNALRNGVDDSAAADKGPCQQGRRQNGYNALHNGRNDSAADFGVNASSAPSSIAVSMSDSEESELLNIREHNPDQARNGHSIAEDTPDKVILHHNSMSHAGMTAASASGAGHEQQSISSRAVASAVSDVASGSTLGIRSEQQSGFSEQAGKEAVHASAVAAALEGTRGSRWAAEHGLAVRDSALDDPHWHGSMPSALQVDLHHPGLQSKSRVPQRLHRRNICGLWTGAARWCRSVPWSQIINLPIVAAFAGLTFGCVPFLKGLLFGSEAPLGFLRDCLELLGTPMIPCMMMVLGAVLHKGPGSVNVPTRLIVGVSAFRLIIIPLLGTAALLLLRRAGVYDPPDALFMLVLFLGHATPTAINVQTIATIHQNGEAEVSCILFWQYMGSIISLPLLLLMFFQLI